MVVHCWVRYCPTRLDSVWSIPIAWIGAIAQDCRPAADRSQANIVSWTACPSQPPRPMFRRRPATRASTAHRHHMGPRRGGEALGGPGCDGHGACTLGLMSLSAIRWGRSGAEGYRWPHLMARLDRNRWSAVVSRKAAATTDTARRYVPTCGGSPSPRRSDPGITGGPRPHTHPVRAGRRTLRRAATAGRPNTGTSVRRTTGGCRFSPAPGPAAQTEAPVLVHSLLIDPLDQSAKRWNLHSTRFLADRITRPGPWIA